MSLVKPVSREKYLHVESTGSGPDVVLLHGWGMHSGYWQGLVDELQEGYRLHCIDLPGHGRSEYDGEQTLDEFVHSIRLTIDRITDQAFYLIGWSLGGLISQRFVIQHPDRVKRLILIASSGSFIQREDWPYAMPAKVLNDFADILSRDYRTTLIRFLALQVWKSENQKQELRDLKTLLFSRGEPMQQALDCGLALLQNTDLRDAMASIDQPVMLLGGEKDTLVPQAALSAIATQLRNVEMHIVRGAGHAPFLSHTDESVKLIRAFLGNE